jgi:TIR domain
MRAIFISYRRDDSEGQAGRLYDDLSRRFGDSSVFMDVAAIEPGLDFRKVIDHNVASCGVLLAVIGPGWLEAKDETGQRRLDNPTDFVRLETASALKRDIPVVPVLVHGARMPKAEQLPADLGELAYRNGLELTHARWDSDVEVLVKALQRHVKDEAEAAETSSKASAAQVSGPVSSVAQAPPAKSHGTLTAVAVVAAAVAVFGLYLGLHRSPQPDAGKSTVIVTPPVQPQPQPQPQPVVVSPPAKPVEPETQPQTSQSDLTATNSPRRTVRKAEITPPPASPTKNASVQTREAASPAPAVVAAAVPASTPAGSDTRSAQTASTDTAKTVASTPAPVTQSVPPTTGASTIYPTPTPMPTPNAGGINPNAQRFVVGHYGATVQDYCVGLMIVDDGYLRYRAIKGTHQIHSFDFPYNRIKEIKKNSVVFSMNLAFHVRMDDGELFNFSEMDPNTFRFLSPDALLNAVHTAAGR